MLISKTFKCECGSNKIEQVYHESARTNDTDYKVIVCQEIFEVDPKTNLHPEFIGFQCLECEKKLPASNIASFMEILKAHGRLRQEGK